MKIQGLAIIAVIIILPMTIILTVYTSNQIKTLELQISYDSKLTNATYDAIKTFQLNMSNNTASDISDSKIKDISASVNTFYNSLASNFNMSGYGKDVLQEYVPVIVYTLYDGYYIYSAYDNTLDKKDNFVDNATYKDGDRLYGLKPYVYYSCRYIDGNSDFVITYSLDSYITIQGMIRGNDGQLEYWNESGYLLTSVKEINGTYQYRGFEIDKSEGGYTNALNQYVYVNPDMILKTQISYNGSQSQNEGVSDRLLSLPCKKINGAKYYYDKYANTNPSIQKNGVFTYVNSSKRYQDLKGTDITINSDGKNYYEEAFKFKEKITSNNTLMALTSKNAVDQYGKYYYDEDIMSKNYKIFEELNNSEDKIQIEDENSEFNAHKMQVIKNSIESNLMVAISNYNKISNVDTNFAMPKLKDEEWEKVSTNISMITFLQGLNIGGKIYNGYSIVPNTNNEDYVSENDIYIIGADNFYHNPTEKDLTIKDGTAGILKSDFEEKNFITENQRYNAEEGIYYEENRTIYFNPLTNKASYKSIINHNGAKNNATEINEYFKKNINDDNIKKIAQKYYTALGRERYGMYRVNNPWVNK